MRPWLGPEEAEAVAATVASGWVAQGPRVAEFERALASRLGAAHGVAMSSCTAALHVGLLLLGVEPGDEVIVPSLSFIATANVVAYAGAVPVFADVDPATLNVTPETVAPALSRRTRAVIVVHQAGTPADLDALHALCDPLGVLILEDAACAIGSTYKDRPIGGGARVAAVSFHPRKLLTTGEGGMLFTTEEGVARRARRLREHGMSVSAAERHQSRGVILEEYDEVGFNYRMTDVQAAIGLVQLARLDAMVERRRALAAAYRDMLADVAGLVTAGDPPWGRTNYQSFWVTLPDDLPATVPELLEGLLRHGIAARRGIMASHLESAYAGVAHCPLPGTERLARRSLILPLHHEMTDGDQTRVVEALRKEAGLSAIV